MRLCLSTLKLVMSDFLHVAIASNLTERAKPAKTKDTANRTGSRMSVLRRASPPKNILIPASAEGASEENLAILGEN